MVWRAIYQGVDGLSLSSLMLTIHYLKICLKFEKSETRAGVQPSETVHTLKSCPKFRKTKMKEDSQASETPITCKLAPSSEEVFRPHAGSNCFYCKSEGGTGIGGSCSYLGSSTLDRNKGKLPYQAYRLFLTDLSIISRL